MKKTKKAAALKYDANKDKAPKLVAKGQGLIAEKIIEKAKEHGVFIKEDPDIVEILSTLDLFEEIPDKLYQAIANILVEVYKINNKIKNLN
ncbi:flagellar biosynthesis protein FlhB [Deferribacter desulfuricans SSM1]|uniref:Flagellar biosynthesis protein FlhB n=1 Tax=Deferribacter desulfuricans (strain DSM 14783 / JCM 11476 / NBRC 101012 / SSM1) TaxID=639282 RepID=D3P9S5_DEFDS|nr:EscU/YscU/HrcU family type III secretion system export apparatus switch protein [Deferribacter desulfuricans]BAI81465.1 flagellar biosynthesis protein FlhB [Deferribacter desulfuricans SSM1]